jgi:hypothetical protein
VRFLGELEKDRLGNVLRAVRIAACEAEGGGIDKVQVASDEFPKGRFGATFDEFSQQSLSLGHFFNGITPPMPETRQTL